MSADNYYVIDYFEDDNAYAVGMRFASCDYTVEELSGDINKYHRFETLIDAISFCQTPDEMGYTTEYGYCLTPGALLYR